MVDEGKDIKDLTIDDVVPEILAMQKALSDLEVAFRNHEHKTDGSIVFRQ